MNDQKVADARFGVPEQFTFTGAAGAKVHAWIVKPVDFDPGEEVPGGLPRSTAAPRAPSATTSTTAGTPRPTPVRVMRQ